MEELKIPTHIGLIVDGNGRWAKKRNLPRSKGHDAGVKRLNEIVLYMFDKGVKYVSPYIFSTENFKRDKEEVDHLMDLIMKFFKDNKKIYQKENIKLIVSGSRANIREDILEAMDELVESTKNNNRGVLNLCFNYGGREEIVKMVQKLNQQVINDEIKIDEITEEIVMKNMYNDLPDIDFLIRTSGEQRVSNFMLYQLSYAEFYFPSTTFPDFNKEEFEDALLVYNKRERRFGGIKK